MTMELLFIGKSSSIITIQSIHINGRKHMKNDGLPQNNNPITYIFLSTGKGSGMINSDTGLRSCRPWLRVVEL